MELRSSETIFYLVMLHWATIREQNEIWTDLHSWKQGLFLPIDNFVKFTIVHLIMILFKDSFSKIFKNISFKNRVN